jgi:hypothetical protein
MPQQLTKPYRSYKTTTEGEVITGPAVKELQQVMIAEATTDNCRGDYNKIPTQLNVGWSAA